MTHERAATTACISANTCTPVNTPTDRNERKLINATFWFSQYSTADANLLMTTKVVIIGHE